MCSTRRIPLLVVAPPRRVKDTATCLRRGEDGGRRRPGEGRLPLPLEGEGAGEGGSLPPLPVGESAESATADEAGEGPLSEEDWPVIMRRLHLSQREGQAMRGIWEGRKHAAIAADLGISRHTVDTHWRRIKQKLNVNGPVEAVHRVYEVVFEMRYA